MGLALSAALAWADTATLTANGDTTVKQGSANTNFGSVITLRVQGSGNNRALVRFDPTQITSAIGNSSLVSATLQLFIETNGGSWPTGGDTVNAHRLTADWT